MAASCILDVYRSPNLTVLPMITSSYQPAPGRFLISEPFMPDANFQRTVILLVEHNENGSLGFVLNRRLEANLGDLIEHLAGSQLPVFQGGPVEQQTLHFIHRLEALEDSLEVGEGVFWGGDFETLVQWVIKGQVDEQDILFFVGYSGWGPGQLSAELERKSWIVAPENSGFVFRPQKENLWKELLKTLGDKFKIISNYPTDPRLN